jgi:hypothetical protein
MQVKLGICCSLEGHKNNSDDLSICTLDGAYTYLGIWIHEKLSFRKHIDELVKKLKNKWATSIEIGPASR